MADWSKVIYVRNVGLDVSESDLLRLLLPFGAVIKVIMSRTKNEALVEMQDLESAFRALEYYKDMKAFVRGKVVHMQFSSHQSLTKEDQSAQRRKSDQESRPNRILSVTIHHMLYPITVEELHQVFCSHGFVEKIAIFHTSAGFQAFVQYESQENAVQARNALQTRNIYDGCCQLHIQFSNLHELQVSSNNDQSRDFTNTSRPIEQSGSSFQIASAAAIEAAFGGVLPRGITGTNDRCTLLVTNLDPDKIDEDKLFNLFSCYGHIIRIKILRSKRDHAFIQMGDGFQAELAVYFLNGVVVFGKKMEVSFSKHPIIVSSADAREYAGSNLNRFKNNEAKHYKYCRALTKIIHLSCLPQDVTEDEIITHLEEHGTILSCKLFEANGKMQALVQFEDVTQATEAIMCKHASTIGWSRIRVSLSLVQNI